MSQNLYGKELVKSVPLCISVVLPDAGVALVENFRIFRVERAYAVLKGKWYFEFEAVTSGEMKVGWARPGSKPDLELGSDDQAFVFDGCKVGVRTGIFYMRIIFS